MKKLNHVFLLFVVIVLEGYIVLSTELLAIRETIPFVGSGTDTVSIIIAAVLMPLAFGYYYGGRFKPGLRKNGRYVSVRKKLVFNIIVSSVIMLFGLSYAILNIFFVWLIEIGIDNRLLMTVIYALLFLVTPVYLLGQTIPLVSNYFSQEKLSTITGRMLFFSTVGSFMGAIFSTLVLMATIGVNYTVVVNFVLLSILVTLLSKHKISEVVICSYALAIGAAILNSSYVMDQFKIVENNQYNTIIVFEDEDGARHLSLNNNASSKFSDDGSKYKYLEFIERIAVKPVIKEGRKINILVIGAGGFTFGHDDTVNHYDFVDIDKTLRKISEEYILRQKLQKNKAFHAMPARAYLTKTKTKYDLVLLDTFLGDRSIPEHLVTREFFQQVKGHLTDDGLVFANFISSPNFASRFSRHIDNTLRSVFPHVSRHIIAEDYQPWNKDPNVIANVVYVYSNQPDAKADHIYTDNKNTMFFDKPHSR